MGQVTARAGEKMNELETLFDWAADRRAGQGQNILLLKVLIK